MPKAVRPYWVLSCPRSASTCSTSGVEDRDRPKPMTAAAAGGCPRPTPRPEQQRAQEHLRGAQAEHQAPHDPQARRLQLQPDDEEQQHDAELGDVRDAADVTDEVETPRADDETGGHVAEDRGQPREAEQRHRDDGRGQQDHGLGEGNHAAGRFSQESAAGFTP